jgi:hypothetical protein
MLFVQTRFYGVAKYVAKLLSLGLPFGCRWSGTRRFQSCR